MPLTAQEREREWLRQLAAITAAWLLIETVTGLWLMLGPFGDAMQVMTLVHTVSGVVLTVPWIWYLMTHLWRRRDIRAQSQAGATGYLALASSIALIVSGVVVTAQAIWGARISDPWKLVHQVATFALVGSVGAHLTTSLWRVWTSSVEDTRAEGLAARRFGWRSVVHVVAAAVIIVVGVSAFKTQTNMKEFSDDYALIYGEDRPFAPSLARTEHGAALAPDALGNSASCGTAKCHPDIVKEWAPSAHRYGAMDPLFQTVQNLMAKENGSESTRYCGGCHDPISLFSGEKMAGETPLSSEMGVAEGVSCLVCHAMTQVDVRGNADYVIAEPPRFMFDPPVSTAGQVTRDFLIRSLGGVHRSSMGHKLLQTPEFCGACHKQFVDVEINKVGWVQLQNQYDNWKASRWYHQDEPKKRLACRDCHMPVQHNSTDPAAAYATDSREKGAHRSHRSLGANQFVPLLLGLEDAQKHTDLIELWLQGKIPVPEIEERWVPGPVVGMTSQLADSVVSVRDSIRVHLTMTNRKAGHDLPTGPLDLIRAWVRLKLIDENGRVVLQTGDPTAEGGDADPKVMFKAEPVNNQGEVLERHNLWDLVGVRFKRALFPGLQDFATMAVPCPVTVIDDPGALTNPIKALSAPRPGVYKVVTEFCYHKAQPRILNAILGPGHGLVAPETIMVSDTTQVRVTS